MKIVVDTNVVFSGMLNTDSRIANSILRPKTTFTYYSTDQLRAEIDNHSVKLMSLAGYTEHEFRRVLELFVRKIRFVDRQIIPDHFYTDALALTEDIDIDDTEFVALAMYLDGRLWSGDKTLKKGLIKKGWNRFISVDELII
ncbi:MAG: PIN domain-containing protein [Tunicatimonas sp.]|uniref:PIN domain-containing protein n=1 Tax=Tunicatimonas sp. TaxID=1940096 RepID=UPI003C7352D4